MRIKLKNNRYSIPFFSPSLAARSSHLVNMITKSTFCSNIICRWWTQVLGSGPWDAIKLMFENLAGFDSLLKLGGLFSFKAVSLYLDSRAANGSAFIPVILLALI